MFLSALLPLVLAASATPVPGSAPNAADARVASEVARLERDLDPASLAALRSAQDKWEQWLISFDQRVMKMLSNQADGTAEIARFRAEVREMRVAFLSAIPGKQVDRIDGGWSDGVTEILLQVDVSDRAKLASFGRDDEGERTVCLVEGVVKSTADGLEMTPDKMPGHRVFLHRQGIALSIDEAAKVTSDGLSLCPNGPFISGKYFRIEGAEEVISWLLN